MFKGKLINLKGDFFSAVAVFCAQGVIKLSSSLVLTRVLTPDAYGLMAIIMSIMLILVMLSDVGFSLAIVRSPKGDEQSFLNTAWTIRIGRAVLNSSILFFAAPLAAAIYHAPALTAPLRALALWLFIDGFESTSFPLATRRKVPRIPMYSELAGTFVSATFSVIYCCLTRSYWGMLWGMVLSRVCVVSISHLFYRESRPKLQWDRAAAKEIFSLGRFIMPSSAITLVLNQYDKAVFPRLFSLELLGVYAVAGNISGPIESLINTASRLILYPRCAHNYRTDESTFAVKYYTDNLKLFIGILAIPASIGGAAHLLITLLYDPRYRQAAEVLQAFMVRASLIALGAPAEEMLMATGESRLYLIGNIYRAIWLPVASIAGYYLYGFMGFTYGVALTGLPALAYYWWLQKRKGMLIARYEIYKVAFLCAVAALAFVASGVLGLLLPHHRIRFR